MTTLLTIKERLKHLYATYDYYVIPMVKFLAALTALLLIGGKIGFMTQIRTVPIVGLIAVVSAILPVPLIVFIICAVMVIHIYALSMELAAVALVLFMLMFFLYYRFTPGDGALLFLIPVLFILKIPYLVPLIVGLVLTPVSVVSVAFGTIIYFMISYISNNAVTIKNLEADGALQKLQMLTDAIFKNKEMYLTILVFAITIVIVYVIKRRAIDYGHMVAVVTGTLTMLALFLIADIVMSVSIFNAGSLIFGSVISALLAVLLDFCVFSVDYTRIERTQFEDDDYYYYVKAVPKVSVSAPEVSVKRINARKTGRRTKARRTHTARR